MDKALNQELVSRVERLEAANRRLKLAGFAFLVFLSIGIVGSCAGGSRQASTTASIITAEKFVLRDSRNNARAELALVEDEPRLTLYGTDNEPGMMLKMDETDPGITFYSGKDRKIKATVGGNLLGAHLVGYDENGAILSMVSASSIVPHIFLGGSNETLRLDISESPIRLRIIDNDGNVVRTLF